MADFKYKIDWVPDAKKQRMQVAEQSVPQGIASRPTPTKPAKKEDDYYTKMYNIMSSYFDSDEEAQQALSSKKPNASQAKQITMEEFERMAEASADRCRAMREDRGITQSLVEGGGEAYRTKPPEGTITRPVARPDELITDTAKDVEESAPVTAETKGAGLMTRPKGSPPLAKLLDFIGAGEGDYDSSNTGTDSKGNIVHYSHNTVRDGKKLSEMTLDEIRSYQAIKDPNDKDRLFTVGKYQLVPETFEVAVKQLGLKGDDVLTPEIQDQMGVFLVSKKPGRSRLSKYLSGDTAVSSDQAMLDLAMEFASIPVPKDIKKGTYGNWPKRDILAGESFYADLKAKKGGNKASHTIAETTSILKDVQGVLTSAQAPTRTPRPKARD